MDLFQAIILAIIQGITEWLPISSSGHLVIMQYLFGLEGDVEYIVLLHIASLIVIFLIFYRDIINAAKNWRYILYLIIGTLPIVIAGLFIRPYVRDIFSNIVLVGFMLILTGVILFFSEKKLMVKDIGNKNAFLVGLFQAVSILPGVSRSGSTIGGAMLLGMKREEAIRFSFLLGIPALLGAAIVNFGEIKSQLTGTMWIGFFLTIIVGYISVKFLLIVIRKNKFRYFSYYCFALGIFIILLGGV